MFTTDRGGSLIIHLLTTIVEIESHTVVDRIHDNLPSSTYRAIY